MKATIGRTLKSLRFLFTEETAATVFMKTMVKQTHIKTVASLKQHILSTKLTVLLYSTFQLFMVIPQLFRRSVHTNFLLRMQLMHRLSRLQ